MSEAKEKKISALGFAILGLLAGETLSGYDLKRWMEEPVGFFWQARHSQIYPELAKLEAAEMVAHRDVPQGGRPDKKLYEITDKGLNAVREWVSEPAKTGATRDEATLKAYLSWLGSPEEMAEMFRGQAAKHRERLAGYRETEEWMQREWGEDLEKIEPRRFAAYAALRRGIGFEREYAGWCEWVAAKLQESGG